MIKPKENKIEKQFDKGRRYTVWSFDRLGFVDRSKLNGKKYYHKEIELSERAVELVNQLEPKPKFMIICGDMLDAFSFKLVKGIRLRIFTPELDPEREEQFETFKKVFSKLNIPLICVCGNHDVGDSPTINLVQQYKLQFGDDYFKFYLNGVLFIALNSNYYYDSQYCEQLADEQDRWLEEILKNEAKLFQHVIVFLHIPLFINHLNEETSILNLPKEKRIKLVDKFRNAGIKQVFCGHIHRNSIAKYKDLECVGTSAIGFQNASDGSGFRVVKVEKNELKHKYYAFEDCPKKLDF